MTNRTLLFSLCLGVIFSVLFNLAITSMAIIYILGDLGGSPTTAPYALVFFGIGNILTLPLAIAFKDQIGTHKFFLLCQTGFILSFFLAAAAPNYPLFILFRFLQGLSSGPLFILMTSFVMRLATEQEKERILSTVLLFFILAPVLGASIGGWIAYDFHWRYIFVLNGFIMIALTAALSWQLRPLSPPLQKQPFDLLGYIAYAIGIFNFIFFLTMGQELDWFQSPLIRINALIAITSLTFFILWTIRSPHPILQFHFLKRPTLTFALFHLAILFCIYFGIIMLLSIWLTLYIRYNAIWVGILFGIMMLSSALLMYIMHNCLHKEKTWLSLGAAILCLSISCFYTSHFNIDVDFNKIALSRILAGMGFALFLPPLVHLTLQDQLPENTPKVFTLFQLTRALSSTLGATIFYTIWLRRQSFYHERLGSTLTEFSTTTQAFFQKTVARHLTPAQSLEVLSSSLERQATSLALNDCFYLMGLLTLLLFLFYLVSFAKRKIANTPIHLTTK